jgi:hypothetical protein
MDTRLVRCQPIEARRRQRPQRRPLLAEPLVDQEATGRVQPPVADGIAPLGVLLVEFAQVREAARRPETCLEVAHSRFDRALLARGRQRAGVRVKAVVAAQVQEPPIPNHLVALAAGNDRTQAVVDPFARHPAQPLEREFKRANSCPGVVCITQARARYVRLTQAEGFGREQVRRAGYWQACGLPCFQAHQPASPSHGQRDRFAASSSPDLFASFLAEQSDRHCG